MKLLSFIFSLYILLLPCLPCTDTEECNDDRGVVSAQSSHDNHQHEEEACNPFCSCSCCGHTYASSFPLQKTTARKIEAYTKQQFCYSNTLFTSAFNGNIWQPPRLS